MKKIKITIEIDSTAGFGRINSLVSDAVAILVPLVASGANAEIAHVYIEEPEILADYRLNSNTLS